MEGFRIALTLACIGLFVAPPAHAQAYPTKPVTIVVTLAAGGAADGIARAVAQRLTEEWGQPVLVENKGGANNQVGTTAVARSAPDGYTLLLTPEHTFTVNPYLYRKLSGQGFHPGHRSRRHQPGPGGASLARDAERRRPDRGGQGQAGRD